MREIWPFGVLLVLIFGANLSLGADATTTALAFSTLILAFVAIFVVFRRPQIGALVWCWLGGAVLLAGLGLVRGWMSVGASEYASLLAGAGIFCVARAGGRSTDQSDRLWMLTLLLGGGVGFLCFIDFIADPRTILGFERTFHGERFSAPFLSANTAATFYGVLSLMALTAVLRALRRCQGLRPEAYARALVLPLSVLAIVITCLFLTGSRAGISLFVLCAAGLAFWRTASEWRNGGALHSLAVPLLVLTAVLVVFWISGGVYSARLDRMDTQLVDNKRWAQFLTYWAAVWHTPVMGQGLGSFPFLARLYETIESARGSMMPNAAHNLVLQWLIQTGFVGTALGAGLLAGLVEQVRRGLDVRRRQRDLIRSGLVIILFVLAHAMVDYALEISGFFWLFCWILGLCAGLANRGRSASRKAAWSSASGLAIGLVIVAGLSGMGAREAVLTDGVPQLTDAAFVERYGQADMETASAARYVAVGDRALRLGDPDYALAIWAFTRALDIEPRDGEVWGKRAYTSYQAFSVMSDASLDDLRQSYECLPYAELEYMRWRTAYALEVWGQLPDDLRAAAQRESRALPRRESLRWQQAIFDAGA